MASAQARMTHCKRGHEFTPENTWISKRGTRRCRTCFRLNKQAQRDRGPGRDYELRYKYGITLDQYERMVESQNGRCYGCEREATLHVDHCHDTKKVRGLLCGSCNRALGLLRDDEMTLVRLAYYLNVNSAVNPFGVVTDR